ncbi:hypothetical protein QF026_007513 [Streptomyces aurantiacus]|nr:hypothetical protein [Streptomyces aurantiacus]
MKLAAAKALAAVVAGELTADRVFRRRSTRGSLRRSLPPWLPPRVWTAWRVCEWGESGGDERWHHILVGHVHFHDWLVILTSEAE